MKKIFYLVLIFIFMMGLSGCSKDSFETAENYNQFTRSYMFSVADSNVTSRIDAERSAGDNIARDIMGSNREVCLINDWATLLEVIKEENSTNATLADGSLAVMES